MVRIATAFPIPFLFDQKYLTSLPEPLDRAGRLET